MQVQLTADKWEQYGSIYLRGRCYQGTMPCALSLLAQNLDSFDTAEQVAAFLQTQRGEFSVVIDKPQLQCIAVSHTRLYPLFYRLYKGNWYVSDEPLKMLKEGDAISESACRQYLYTGAPFAGNTLVQFLQQGKPAYVTCMGTDTVTQVSFGPYASLSSASIAADSLDAAFDNVLQTIFKRAVHTIGQRQVVVPLSGGYDSRLVLSMLHRLGIKNILCYTVGAHNPSEQGIACQVAQTLQIPLYHIDYREPQYRMQAFHSSEFLHYIDHVGAMGNFMWLFEYNAILWLKQQGLLQYDAIFMPGHVGDFYAGSHLQKLGIKEHDSLTNVAQKLLLHAFEYGKPNRDAVFKKELKQALQALDCGRKSYQLALQFIAENRLAHQILNSARVYEYLGYDVLLPLCDVDFVQFFENLPYQQRFDVSFYHHFLLEKVFAPLQIAFQKPSSAKKMPLQRFKNKIKLLLPRTLYLRYKQRSDLTTETYLLHEMLDELAKNGMANQLEDYVNGNELMLHWYLNRVKKQLGI